MGKLGTDLCLSTPAVSLESKSIEINILVLRLSRSLEPHVCYLQITPEHCFLCIYNYIFSNVLEVTDELN